MGMVLGRVPGMGQIRPIHDTDHRRRFATFSSLDKPESSAAFNWHAVAVHSSTRNVELLWLRYHPQQFYPQPCAHVTPMNHRRSNPANFNIQHEPPGRDGVEANFFNRALFLCWKQNRDSQMPIRACD